VCLWAGEYQIETLQIKDNIVKTLSIRRQSKPESDSDAGQETEETAQPVV
jgi:hypothetical protein